MALLASQTVLTEVAEAYMACMKGWDAKPAISAGQIQAMKHLSAADPRSFNTSSKLKQWCA
jgi:hypothetical protein